MNNKPKYIVSPYSSGVWVLHPESGRYQPYFKTAIENRQVPYDHWNYDELVNNLNFMPIKDDQFDYYKAKHVDKIKFESWQGRNDGHGGIKGETREEYDVYLERLERYKTEINKMEVKPYGSIND